MRNYKSYFYKKNTIWTLVLTPMKFNKCLATSFVIK